jgi:hypothetical protein
VRCFSSRRWSPLAATPSHDAGVGHSRGDLGASLVEILVSVVLLGVAGTAVLAALAVSVVGSSQSKSHAAQVAWLQSAADALSRTPFVDCAAGSEGAVATTYQHSLRSSTDPSRPAGWPRENLSVSSPVLFWDGDSFEDFCAASPSQLQQITLKASNPALTSSASLIVVKSKP